MKRNKIGASTESSTELFTSGEVIRKFKFAFAGTTDKNLKTYRVAKKAVAQILTSMNAPKQKSKLHE